MTDTLTEEDRLHAEGLRSGAEAFGRKLGCDQREGLVNELESRTPSAHPYQKVPFKSLADRDLFIVNAKRAFLTEFDIPL